MRNNKGNPLLYHKEVQQIIDGEDERSFRQESRKYSKCSLVISIISIIIAFISLIVSIFK